jgi:hypothetical protein
VLLGEVIVMFRSGEAENNSGDEDVCLGDCSRILAATEEAGGADGEGGTGNA